MNGFLEAALSILFWFQGRESVVQETHSAGVIPPSISKHNQYPPYFWLISENQEDTAKNHVTPNIPEKS